MFLHNRLACAAERLDTAQAVVHQRKLVKLSAATQIISRSARVLAKGAEEDL
jgi:hypothetical protein